MSLPFALPDWLPGWALVAVLLPAMLYGLALLTMPFTVFGLRGRLERLDARLDEIQGEIRALSLRVPEPARRGAGADAARLEIPRFDLPPIPAQPPTQPAAPPPLPTPLEMPVGMVRPPVRAPMPDPVLRAQPVPPDPPPSFLAPPHRPPPVAAPTVAPATITPRPMTMDPMPPRRPIPARLPPTRPDSARTPPDRTEPRLDWPRD